jgi:hypothetical protein
MVAEEKQKNRTYVENTRMNNKRPQDKGAEKALEPQKTHEFIASIEQEEEATARKKILDKMNPARGASLWNTSNYFGKKFSRPLAQITLLPNNVIGFATVAIPIQKTL